METLDKKELAPGFIKEVFVGTLEEYKREWLEYVPEGYKKAKEEIFDATIAVHVRQHPQISWFKLLLNDETVKISKPYPHTTEDK